MLQYGWRKLTQKQMRHSNISDTFVNTFTFLAPEGLDIGNRMQARRSIRLRHPTQPKPRRGERVDNTICSAHSHKQQRNLHSDIQKAE